VILLQSKAQLSSEIAELKEQKENINWEIKIKVMYHNFINKAIAERQAEIKRSDREEAKRNKRLKRLIPEVI
jgi:septal ring factor EnvC (AmiA/AmiB activator)